MKTLHLTNAYHPTSGGIRQFYDALLRGCSPGWQLRLVVPAEETSAQDLNGHARIYGVRAPRSAVFDSRYRVLLPMQTLAPGSTIIQILRAEQPDLVEVCDKYSLCYLAGALRKGWFSGIRRPVLVGLSCERMDDNVASYLGLGRLGRALAALYMRRVYVPKFDHHLANSDYTAGELRHQAPKHQRSVHVLPMGVEIDRFGPFRRDDAARRALLERVDGNATTRILVYAGRLASEKNVGLLPATLEHLTRQGEDYRLVVAGDGPLAASNAGGVTTYATEATAWPAAPDPEAFARRIREVFADPDDRARKIARALVVAREYRWDVVVQQFFATYEQMIRGSTGTPLMIS